MREIPRVQIASPQRLTAPRIVVGCFKGEEPELDGVAAPVREAVTEGACRPGWRGGEHQSAEVAIAAGARPRVVSLQGLGAREKLDHKKLKNWLGRLMTDAATNGVQRLALVLPRHETTSGREAARRVVCELALAEYRFDRFRERDEDTPTPVQEVQLLPPAQERSAYLKTSKSAQAVAAGIALARDLGNTPPNVASPQWLAAEARGLAEHFGMKVLVLGPRELERRGMGGVLAVGGASVHPPRLVRLEWGSRGPSVALVGKGITFDTGGISLKPAADMHEMKYDKCGACTVLGILRAVAELDLPVRVHAYLALAENMPGGKAYRPSDIVRCFNGKTVEIVSTDAEGRMVLADAMAWAAKRKPDYLAEFSTLTGAAVVALGTSTAGLFTPDSDFAAQLLEAAEGVGEQLWRLPLYPEFLEEMKGNHADLKNSAGRWGGANTAAAFLSQFVGTLQRWAHIDIAGPAYNLSAPPRGATGYGVALTVHWLERLADS